MSYMKGAYMDKIEEEMTDEIARDMEVTGARRTLEEAEPLLQQHVIVHQTAKEKDMEFWLKHYDQEAYS